MGRSLIIAVALFLTVSGTLRSDEIHSTSELTSFNQLRAEGQLNNDRPQTFDFCDGLTNGRLSRCKTVGTIAENNLIEWKRDVTVRDLKGIVQSFVDLTRWRMNNPPVVAPSVEENRPVPFESLPLDR